ncbi:reprolysin-like metallopeptidase [Formosa sp. PL04]|uniref:reprolysin-like metallopeptidase n=1 Tax=Formosa sp. PL04 TaxID=3081755 RepID=UPI0029811475|nr:zinc-dependent metalloprotease family protein [Formosa sp. PL04]MDW5287192.1 zinc-dependent metalloprotease family protein [Formosa sp. PL04]
MKKLFLLLIVSLHVSFIFGQNTSNFWKNVSNERVASATIGRKTQPEKFKVFQLDLDAFKTALKQAPLSDNRRNSAGMILDFPMSDGSFQQFEVTESSIMGPKLSAKFPMIKTYKAIGIDDKTATMRFSVTQNGLHVFSLSGQRSSVFIDPYTVEGEKYMVYNRSDLGIDTQDFECLTDDNIDLKSLKTDLGSQISSADDSTLRTYRLALTCNSKYGALFAGEGTEAEKKANIQAQMAITINRVNEIYERDLAITLVFIDRNDELIYYDLDNDPWSNEYNEKTQEVISTTLNDESLYDIGHNFNTTNGGNSGCIGCVCVDAVAPYTEEVSKGRGYTGLFNPTGDAFDIDFVAHEMGHQFGAWHTMNTCSRSGNGRSEVEPASGSSIMGYSGVCGVNNVQEHSDAYFNYVNIRDVSQNVQPGGVSACGEQTVLENKPPVALAGLDYTIPVSTPFVLRGEGTDPDGTSTLTYSWSQNDPERAPADGAPQSTWTVGPMYRSILPTVSPDRYLPDLSDVTAGNITPKWEVTPSVARSMNFAFTVRDNGSGFPIGIGQVNTDLMKVTVVDGTPFTVSKPNRAEDWYVGISRDIEWIVGETNSAPINSEKVNIKLSLDGGSTYPITLASNVDNDGSETIVVPDNESDRCRIMVEAADNIFYDISDSDFSIKKSGPIFVLELTDEIFTFCNSDASLNIPFQYTTVSGFNEVTTFSVSNLPTGVTASFAATTAQEDADIILTLKNFDKAAIDAHAINIIGKANSLTQYVVATLQIEASQINSPNLSSPANGATEVSEDITLSWEASEYALKYELEVSTSSDFSAEVNFYQLSDTYFDFQALEPLTTYYWRVRALNECAVSENSKVSSFTTSLCTRCASSGNDSVPSLVTSTTRVIFNSIDNVSGKTGYSDFTSIENQVKRGGDYPISIYVNTSGDYTTNTIVWIDWNNNCDFNDAGEMYELGEATNVTNGITTNSPLIITVPLDAVLSDETIMRVATKYRSNPTSCETGYDGEVEDYKLEVQPTLGVEDNNFSSFNIWPNPNKGAFTVSLKATSANNVNIVLYDISGRQVFSKSYKSDYAFSQNIVLDHVASGLYLLEVNNGVNKTIKKIVVE